MSEKPQPFPVEHPPMPDTLVALLRETGWEPSPSGLPYWRFKWGAWLRIEVYATSNGGYAVLSELTGHRGPLAPGAMQEAARYIGRIESACESTP